MRRPATGGNAEDSTRDRMDQELQFQRVALLFSAIPVPLLFFGRSQGTSLTSTTTAVNTVPASVKVFFPGSENRPLCNSASSTRTTVRKTVVSWMPQSWPRWKYVRYSRQNSSVNSSCAPTGNAGGRPDLPLLASRSCSTASISANVSGSTPVLLRKSVPFSCRACSYFNAVIPSSLPPYFRRRSSRSPE